MCSHCLLSAAVGQRGVPGDCSEWTQAVVYGLNVEEWLSLDLAAVVGSQFTGWALNGKSTICLLQTHFEYRNQRSGAESSLRGLSHQRIECSVHPMFRTPLSGSD